MVLVTATVSTTARHCDTQPRLDASAWLDGRWGSPRGRFQPRDYETQPIDSRNDSTATRLKDPTPSQVPGSMGDADLREVFGACGRITGVALDRGAYSFGAGVPKGATVTFDTLASAQVSRLPPIRSRQKPNTKPKHNSKPFPRRGSVNGSGRGIAEGSWSGSAEGGSGSAAATLAPAQLAPWNRRAAANETQTHGRHGETRRTDLKDGIVCR